jgi:hypothetical protein
MDNVHRDYLLKRFREERRTIVDIATRDLRDSVVSRRVRNAVDEHLDEIEYQINRAFDDADAAKGGAP